MGGFAVAWMPRIECPAGGLDGYLICDEQDCLLKRKRFLERQRWALRVVQAGFGILIATEE